LVPVWWPLVRGTGTGINSPERGCHHTALHRYTKDKSSIDVCPVSYIYLETDDLDRKLYIHPDVAAQK
jgi:hypothetical protein